MAAVFVYENINLPTLKNIIPFFRIGNALIQYHRAITGLRLSAMHLTIGLYRYCRKLFFRLEVGLSRRLSRQPQWQYYLLIVELALLPA